MNQQSPSLRSGTLVREPLVLFVLVGLLAWFFVPEERGGNLSLEGPATAADSAFEVEKERARFLEERGREPNSEEMEHLRAWHASRIQLVDEAVRLGLHYEDPEVERRLLDALANVVGSGVREPSAEELQRHFTEFFRNQNEREVDFTWVTLPAGTTVEDASNWVQKAESGDWEWAAVGGRPAEVRRARERGLASRLPLPIVETALTAELHRWVVVTGKPIAALRVGRRELRPAPSFDRVKNRVREDWKQHERIRLLTEWKEQMQREESP